ncbi:transglycosylase SLT domain-containing protein [Propionivibrio limicola]|uniref:transglycosylase SLT domain-containing protein n=1 Tax=Propionivibrio limicola TaxID=167645 RepID=UPI00129103FE|nr:transglycosylase SLT domain-containing protein [Propionivibrio limicola]
MNSANKHPKGRKPCIRAAFFLCSMFVTNFVSAAEANAPSASDLAALRNEARAYEHGEGVRKDPLHAAKLYCDGARHGDPEAQYSLGWMYANGRGLPRSDELAAYFFKLAADQGHEPSRKMLRFVGEKVAPVPECMNPVLDDRESDVMIPPDNPLQQKIQSLVRDLSPEYGVSPRLVMAVIRAESNFNPTAVSPKNAQGLMQLIPDTSVRFNVRKPFDPEQNIRGGLSYLRWLLAYFEGDVALVAAAYNAGEGAVNRYRGIPPYAETQSYVRRILDLFKRNEHPFDPEVTPPSPELPSIRNTKKVRPGIPGVRNVSTTS